MPSRRKDTTDIRELLRHIQANRSDRAVNRATGMHRLTVKRYREWAAEQSLLGDPLLASAGPDRLAQRAEILIITGGSFRAQGRRRLEQEVFIEPSQA